MAIQNSRKKTTFQSISEAFGAHTKPIFMVLSFVAAMVLLFFAHKLWVTKRERAAQYDFSALMTEYDGMSHEKDPQWSSLLEKFEQNYEKHSSSSLLPYYLGYKVQILLAQDKKEEALATLDTMISDMPGSPMLALYEMERALIQLDTTNSELNNVGLEALKVLANNNDNMFRDSAQYYLGRYYWAQNNTDAAREVWQQLVDEQRDEKIASSPWVQQVQEQLALTIV
jgi:predicted negative regulator of RcsB-dependent stress response